MLSLLLHADVGMCESITHWVCVSTTKCELFSRDKPYGLRIVSSVTNGLENKVVILGILDLVFLLEKVIKSRVPVRSCICHNRTSKCLKNRHFDPLG